MRTVRRTPPAVSNPSYIPRDFTSEPHGFGKLPDLAWPPADDSKLAQALASMHERRTYIQMTLTHAESPRSRRIAESESAVQVEPDTRDLMRTREVERWLNRHLHQGNVLHAYDKWPSPSAIISDGAYGVGGFPGDPRTPEELADWYRPHIESWSRSASPATTLWFWNTEVGWATVHPLLVEHGWEYVQTVVWDKGIAHIAGNVNGDTIRQLPVATEVCAFYRRRLEFPSADGSAVPAKVWLRAEWQRAGLTLNQANEACGVRNAATRKYLTQDWLWYFPPADMMKLLVAYANEHGDPAGRPYFSIDGKKPVTTREWKALRHPWTHQHAVTNVWTLPPLNGKERYRGNGKRSAPRVYNPGKNATNHLNQKPLVFMERIITAATTDEDVIWEPFGGLCSASVAAVHLGREPFAAELIDDHCETSRERLGTALREAHRKAKPTGRGSSAKANVVG